MSTEPAVGKNEGDGDGLVIRLVDERTGKQEDFACTGGVKALVAYANYGKRAILVLDDAQ
jgi:hypothetical protein